MSSTLSEREYHHLKCRCYMWTFERSPPLMKLIDFRHVAEQDVLLAEQGGGDEVSHGRVVHLSRVALRDIFFFVIFNCYSLLFSFPAHILLRIVTRGALTSSTHSSSSTYARSVSSSSFITWLEHWKTPLIGWRQGSVAPFRRFNGAQKYIRSHLNDKNKAEMRK